MYALGLGTGVLYFLAFPPYGVHVFGWLALIPLCAAIRIAPTRRIAWRAGALAAMAAVLGGYFWIADTAHRFWEAPWPFAVLLLAVYGMFAEIHFTLFAWTGWMWQRRLPGGPALGLATLFTLCEIVVPRIFPDKLGHTLIDVGSLPFAAALVGTHGLTFVMAWAASAAAALLVERGWRVRQRVVEMALALVAVVGLGLVGAHENRTRTELSAPRALDVALVQSNLGDPETLADDLGSVTLAIDSTIALYAGLTYRSAAGHDLDLVVWPETAVPSVPRLRTMAPLQVMVQSLGVPLLFGGYDSERVLGSRWRLFNSAFLMNPEGELTHRYYKHKLLLFGEYVPLSERFPFLLDILPAPGEFTPGPGPRVFPVRGVQVTPLICYELLFPRVVRAAVRDNAQVIVNLTNDYWFGKHLEPFQHLELARMCAIETARPIVRATNTGISALIDHRGRILAQSGLWTQEVLRGTLPIPEPVWTAYARWGERATAVLAAVCWVIVGIPWIVLRQRPRVARRS